ncbi:branched-chain amino acid ABC transporter substrate-binding protein [Caballeronia sp. LZ034LL]|uniref:branched-chain amino acid ABC transporter substrate-binding protein n=1 Tax=Caballeronia sp. LZ034LL TaxID=3038567 RepID=UPI0028668A96|nr:branched-chain amino acid ABC transporter substrate-binding protein [Caballeronia sp. LZ034LL]MDR5833106.1 branched-chain amino acid ABC transporter substrate-binding protein [Caballeronia sp. LZ034LL]
MRFKFAHAVSIAAAVAMATACGKKDEGGASTAASAASAAALPAASAPAQAEATVVKIGHVAPLTGLQAHLGRDNENGARLALEEISAQGLTIDGHSIRLELDSQDDAADPRTGTEAAQKLVDDHVVAVIGHMNSGVSIPASKIYSDAGIAQISPSTTNPEYTRQGYKTTFRLVSTDALQGPVLAGYAMKTLHAKKVVVVDDASAYGRGLADEFAKTVQAGGVKIAAREQTTEKARNFKAILTKIKRIQPDVVMYGGMDVTGGPFAKEAAALGIKAKILAGDGVCTDKVAELAGDAVQNLVCSEAGLALSKMDKGADFAKKYEARFHTPVQIYAPFTYDAMYVIVDAMKRANSIEAPKVLAAIATTDFNGLTGHIAFDDRGDLKAGTITLYDFKDKKKDVLDVVKQ